MQSDLFIAVIKFLYTTAVSSDACLQSYFTALGELLNKHTVYIYEREREHHNSRKKKNPLLFLCQGVKRVRDDVCTEQRGSSCLWASAADGFMSRDSRALTQNSILKGYERVTVSSRKKRHISFLLKGPVLIMLASAMQSDAKGKSAFHRRQVCSLLIIVEFLKCVTNELPYLLGNIPVVQNSSLVPVHSSDSTETEFQTCIIKAQVVWYLNVKSSLVKCSIKKGNKLGANTDGQKAFMFSRFRGRFGRTA